MTVTLKLKSGLDKLLDRGIFEIEIEGGKSLTDVLKNINFPVERAGIVLVDGKKSTKNHELHDGEVIKIFPHTIGC